MDYVKELKEMKEKAWSRIVEIEKEKRSMEYLDENKITDLSLQQRVIYHEFLKVTARYEEKVSFEKKYYKVIYHDCEYKHGETRCSTCGTEKSKKNLALNF